MYFIVPVRQWETSFIEHLQRFRLLTDQPILVVGTEPAGPDAVLSGEGAPVTYLSTGGKKGRGQAIKTALAYLRPRAGEKESMMLFMDKHFPSEEVLRAVTQTAADRPQALLLGQVKEDYERFGRVKKFGFGLTKYAFAFASGLKLRDVKPSFVVCSCAHIGWMEALSGNKRQEYLTHLLLTASRKRIPLVEMPVEMLSSGSSPVIFRGFARAYLPLAEYLGSSFVSFLVEYVLFLMLNHVFDRTMGPFFSLIFSVTVSRVISCIVNFILNRWVVFKHTDPLLPAFLKYSALAAVILLAHNLFMQLLVNVLHIPEPIAFPISECILFAVGGILQRLFVFPSTPKSKKSDNAS